MFRLCIACIVFAAAGVHAAALTEDSCSAIVSKEGEKPDLHSVAGLSVLSLRPDHPLMMRAEGGVKIHGVVCWRSEAQLAENDYLVTDAGFPLYIKTDLEDASHNRTLILERTRGGFRTRLVDGPELSAEEKDETQKLLLAGLPPGYVFFVTARLLGAEGRSETAFIRVQSIKEGMISGVI
jgi:hypothetical protein